MLSYKEQLIHPNWQRKRLEILQRDDFKCRKCGCDNIQLQVHHIIYLNDIHIWEYNDNLLITLCKDCHDQEYNKSNIGILSMWMLNRICKLTNNSLNQIDVYFEKLDYMIGMEEYSPNEAFKILLLKIINSS